MSQDISIWTLKKMPLQQVIQYIERNSTPDYRARMAKISKMDYERLPAAQAQDKLAAAISNMSEEEYTDYLLELVDE
ncbi:MULTISPECIES: hypothetical protein [Paenibacillus]|uniref:Uncharacterized protein n=1 Tax=Paenibacillus albilobatus TaxID=2716884 RepID=A0A919XLT5_9BACL|nr:MULTISPECIES: hypothetical protein [Paenibacillus]GIO33150.1 hypothetical protein J2TS6_42910 [Paenibacillus albilobatus]